MVAMTAKNKRAVEAVIAAWVRDKELREKREGYRSPSPPQRDLLQSPAWLKGTEYSDGA